MKTHLVTASALAGLSLISGTAFAQTGSVGADFTRVESDAGDADAYGADAEVKFGVGGGWDGMVEASFTDSDETDSVFAARAHMFNSGPNNAWGGFIGGTTSDGDSAYQVGAEYAQFFDGSTLAFNGTYGTDDSGDVDVYGVNAAYRIFASSNLRFDLIAGFARAEGDGFDADGSQVGAGVEWRMDNSPFSVGATFVHVDGEGADADVFGVTLRWNFGDQSLKDADRKGKTFRMPDTPVIFASSPPSPPPPPPQQSE